MICSKCRSQFTVLEADLGDECPICLEGVVIGRQPAVDRPKKAMTYLRSICLDCNHAEVLHDRWGICTALGCGPCHDEFKCPRCGHVFLEHIISEKEVCCIVVNCKSVVCYATDDPGKMVPREGLVVTEQEFSGTYSALPAVYQPKPPKRNPVEKGWSK